MIETIQATEGKNRVNENGLLDWSGPAACQHLPDAQNGYYRGTRFDWSGVVYRLQYKGHNYYGPWVQRTDAKVRDFVYEGADIVGGPCSSIAGPADEFGQVGWEEAKPGGGRRTTSSWNWPWKAGPISCLP